MCDIIDMRYHMHPFYQGLLVFNFFVKQATIEKDIRSLR